MENNKLIQRKLFEVRTMMGSNLFDYFDFYGQNDIPNFFEPSFLQASLEKEYRNQPS